MLASRLFREIYDIALLKRTEEENGEDREREGTEGEKGEENNAREGGSEEGMGTTGRKWRRRD